MLDGMRVVMGMWWCEGKGVTVDHGLQGLLGSWFETRRNEVGQIVIYLHFEPMGEDGVIGWNRI